MTDQRKEFQDRFALSGQVTSAGKFEVDAITAGEGNGWQFSEETLRESLELWEGVECFVDHAYAWGGRSVRDLGGVFHKPHWCEETHGVRLELATIGPSGELVAELGRQLLAETVEQRPRVGFSADVVFTANKKEVQKILRVISVDLVFNPARGGM